jgi:CheY-like chemotaxis protein
MNTPDQSPASTQEKIPVLLAEDNLLNQELVREFLSDTPFDVTITDNGQRAVEAFQQQRFDIVLMDCQMPIMDGYDACRAIRNFESNRALPRIPIIAITANAVVGDREACIAAGMDDYLTKPFGGDALLSVIAKWLNAPRQQS